MLGKIAYMVNSTYTDYENNDNMINFQGMQVKIENNENYDFSENNKNISENTEMNYSLNSETVASEEENEFLSGRENNNFAVKNEKKETDSLRTNEIFTREVIDDIVSKIDDELGELSLMRERGR